MFNFNKIPNRFISWTITKIIVVDRKIAVDSSMNFFPNSSAGASWEAGMVSIDSNVIDRIVKSIIVRID